MPNTYRRKPGSRRYIDYTSSELDECIAAIKSKVISQRAASKKYNIPRSTMPKRKLNAKKTRNSAPIQFQDLTNSDRPQNNKTNKESPIIQVDKLRKREVPLKDFDSIQIEKGPSSSHSSCSQNKPPEFKENIGAGDHVIVQWNQHFYPGQVISLSEEAVLVRCMKKGKDFWRWPVITRGKPK